MTIYWYCNMSFSNEDKALFKNLYQFLRARASIAIARISYGNSVYPSVRHDLVPIQDQVR